MWQVNIWNINEASVCIYVFSVIEIVWLSYIHLCLNAIAFSLLEAVRSHLILIVNIETLKMDLCICKIDELFTSIYFPLGPHFHYSHICHSWLSTLLLLTEANNEISFEFGKRTYGKYMFTTAVSDSSSWAKDNSIANS